MSNNSYRKRRHNIPWSKNWPYYSFQPIICMVFIIQAQQKKIIYSPFRMCAKRVGFEGIGTLNWCRLWGPKIKCQSPDRCESGKKPSNKFRASWHWNMIGTRAESATCWLGTWPTTVVRNRRIFSGRIAFFLARSRAGRQLLGLRLRMGSGGSGQLIVWNFIHRTARFPEMQAAKLSFSNRANS